MQAVLGRVEDACHRVGLDADRTKMLIQILIFGGPIDLSQPGYPPLPDVSQMTLALETVQTWFNAGNLRTPALDADLLMQMNHAGYPIAGMS